MTDEEILNQLHDKLVEAAKVTHFDLVPLSSVPNTRAFLAYAVNRCTKVLLSATPTEMTADIILDRNSLNLSPALVGDEILKLLQR